MRNSQTPSELTVNRVVAAGKRTQPPVCACIAFGGDGPCARKVLFPLGSLPSRTRILKLTNMENVFNSCVFIDHQQ